MSNAELLKTAVSKMSSSGLKAQATEVALKSKPILDSKGKHWGKVQRYFFNN